MNLRAVLVLIVMMLIGGDVVELQGKPDFSGTWSLTEYRIGEKVVWRQGGGNQNVMVGGGTVNCGLRCTIIQTAEALTVSRAPGTDGAKPREEVVFVDGRPMPNQAVVRWEGSRLTLVRKFADIVVTQTLALEKDRLVVVASLNTGDVGPYVLTYVR